MTRDDDDDASPLAILFTTPVLVKRRLAEYASERGLPRRPHQR